MFWACLAAFKNASVTFWDCLRGFRIALAFGNFSETFGGLWECLVGLGPRLGGLGSIWEEC